MGLVFSEILSLKEIKHQDHDVEVCHGSFSLRSGSKDKDWLGKCLRASFPGEDGYSVLHFTMLQDVILATVEAMLITKGDNRRSHGAIYGSLTACNSNYKYDSKYDAKYFTSVLFDVPRDKAIEVIKPSEIREIKIPLSRKVVGVPT